MAATIKTRLFDPESDMGFGRNRPPYQGEQICPCILNFNLLYLII